MSTKMQNGWDFQIANHSDYPKGVPSRKEVLEGVNLTNPIKSSNFKAWTLRDGARILVMDVMKEGHLYPNELTDLGKLRDRNNLERRMLNQAGYTYEDGALADEVQVIYEALIGPYKNGGMISKDHPSNPLLAQTVILRFRKAIERIPSLPILESIFNKS